MKVTFQN